ncbi:hypothetical protein [Parasedimentitalea psychrophila]|uniref:Uncharacterized protein n=1 Tax=Parasedimentitalea psychrophila TaxID=2997337 RepID=A0A9Y2KZ22_9RHOB|nr:hypothetical protein [Parasedimentitalea psychrophila]WIY23809.1 hypothetical protein QPJ95_14300 [Parasedimentitalea psychrophila]
MEREPGPQTAASPKGISGSFLGGDIGRGFRRVGEQGPETIWNSKGGYVAHASVTARLSRLSARAAPLMSALGIWVVEGLREGQRKFATHGAPPHTHARTSPSTSGDMMADLAAFCHSKDGEILDAIV